MAATLRSGCRLKAPWHTIAVMVSVIGRFLEASIRNGSSLNGSISCGPVQSAW
jgi:hypothetical protein